LWLHFKKFVQLPEEVCFVATSSVIPVTAEGERTLLFWNRIEASWAQSWMPEASGPVQVFCMNGRAHEQ
jgi:hypothetical protein